METLIYVLVFVVGILAGSAYTLYQTMVWVKNDPEKLAQMAKSFCRSDENSGFVKVIDVEYENGKYYGYDVNLGTFLGCSESLESLIDQIGTKFPEYDIAYNEPKNA